MTVLQTLQHRRLHVMTQTRHLHGGHSKRTCKHVVMASTQAGGIEVVPVLFGHHGAVDRVLRLELLENRHQVEVGVLLSLDETFELGSLE